MSRHNGACVNIVHCQSVGVVEATGLNTARNRKYPRYMI